MISNWPTQSRMDRSDFRFVVLRLAIAAPVDFG
jgi:hypothetical protein